MWWKKHKWNVLVPVIVIAILAVAFCAGGDVPPAKAPPAVVDSSAVQSSEPESSMPQVSADKQESNPGTDALPKAESEAISVDSLPEEPQAKPEADVEKDSYQTDPVPDGMPKPSEPQEAEISDTACSCTISINCATILDNLDDCDPAKTELLPEDGWILAPITVPFYEGESVFNVLQRVCKQQRIHMEYMDTPLYNSAYIEGIHNLYEFDVGDLSGWMYSVNGWFPNYGCSRYQLQDGDVICWVYTCDLGADVGGDYASNH